MEISVGPGGLDLPLGVGGGGLVSGEPRAAQACLLPAPMETGGPARLPEKERPRVFSWLAEGRPVKGWASSLDGSRVASGWHREMGH